MSLQYSPRDEVTEIHCGKLSLCAMFATSVCIAIACACVSHANCQAVPLGVKLPTSEDESSISRRSFAGEAPEQQRLASI